LHSIASANQTANSSAVKVLIVWVNLENASLELRKTVAAQLD